MEIKNVIICGLGALGLTYASKLKDCCNLRILANPERIKKYTESTPTLNDEKIFLNYISPAENFPADLIIITTKATGLDSAIEYIKNFVTENTIIISLINGISSEKQIASTYPQAKIVHSFFIGHSAIRSDEKVTQDGIGKIVLEQNTTLEMFFKNNNIDFEITKNIHYSMWIKLGVNIILNELSAIYKCSVGELRKNQAFLPTARKLLKEIKDIANAYGIKDLDNYEQDVLHATSLIADSGKTSMYQDIIAKRKTEIDIFSGEIIRLGKIYKIKTSYNEEIYSKIKEIERDFS